MAARTGPVCDDVEIPACAKTEEGFSPARQSRNADPPSGLGNSPPAHYTYGIGLALSVMPSIAMETLNVQAVLSPTPAFERPVPMALRLAVAPLLGLAFTAPAVAAVLILADVGEYAARAADAAPPPSLADEERWSLNHTWRRDWGIQNFAAVANVGETDVERAPSVVAVPTFELGGDRFSVPLTHREGWGEQGDYLSLNSVALEWQRALGMHHLLNAGAHLGSYEYDVRNPRSANALQASVGWTGIYGGDTRPQLGGTLYMGDEDVEETALGYFGRRYYGLTLDGAFTPYRGHSPFLSLRFQWSDYDEPDPAFRAARKEDYSRLGAGWDWQVSSQWRMRAQADYSINSSNLTPYEFDRSRLFFSTRYDFR